MKPGRKCYIAGKIGDLPEAEFKANFQAAVNDVYEPVSPLELPHNHNKSWQAYMKEDITAMLQCKAVYVLKNWRTSPGATIEVELAMKLSIDIIFQK
ncbi:DUF4406 domain-containing protein [Flavobacterium coralii]|uniref:DUF4406 domain-containing protein n=1 Tax=Flavobacterium coralii TaxID=2838017 RepID=UPI000C5C33FD|nr:hypothetical protein [Flavobacterium sp.]|tara:strand:- start:200 stop:490 length:291 start_codon:yes stop_codon:yes gene_type:complete